MDFSNSLIRSFCLLLNLTGVSTFTRHNRSPVAPPLTDLTPLPRIRNNLPVCVSVGIFSRSFPLSVGTSISPPSVAVPIEIGISQNRSLSSRVKISCGLTCICTYRSPLGAPFSPASPSPASRIRSPVSTPAGTLTESVFCSCLRPWPWQSGQGSLIILPLPRHCGQVCCTAKNPCCIRTCPAPPQVVQVVAEVPSFAPLPEHVLQPTRVGTRIFTSVPNTASSRDNSRLYCRSAPVWTR